MEKISSQLKKINILNEISIRNISQAKIQKGIPYCMILNDDKLNIKNQIGDYKMRKNWIIKNIVIFYYIKLKIYIFIYVHMYKRAAVYKINTF